MDASNQADASEAVKRLRLLATPGYKNAPLNLVLIVPDRNKVSIREVAVPPEGRTSAESPKRIDLERPIAEPAATSSPSPRDSSVPIQPASVAPATGAARHIETDETIGQIGPGPVEMDRTGTYVVSGSLFHDEVRSVAILKDCPVILQSRLNPSNQRSPHIRVYARIADASVGQISTIEKQPTTRAYLSASFKLVREAYPLDGTRVEIRSWTPKPMAGYRIRWPTKEDLELLGFPSMGLAMGWHEIGPSKLPYYLPIDSLYRSLFVVGGMGGGKTNFLSCITRAIANSDPALFAGRRRPAVVVLDAEGRREYADLGGDVPENLRTQVEDAGIAPHGIRDFHYHVMGPGGRTFKLDDITSSDTSVFPATLPAKSERAWTSGAERFWTSARSSNRQVVRTEFTAAMSTMAFRLGLNAAMRNAIIRAAQDQCWDVFDMPDATPLGVPDLLVPGRVSVVDTSRLEGQDRQRAAGLALLTLFDIAKRSSPQDDCPILLVVDEATRLVPANYGGMSSREYTQKMGMWLGDILHRGRRASYGLLLATQYPDDVLKGLADQPQTKIASALPPKYDRWINSNFLPGAAGHLRESALVGLGYVARTARVEGDPAGVPHPATMVHFPRVR